MKWAAPQYERLEVNAAGRLLISNDATMSTSDRDDMLQVINNWRSAHGFPLQCMKMTLFNRARRIDRNATVAQRLKRLSSIDAKLRQQEWMKLSQMQDIGGCRAILRSIRTVRWLVRVYKRNSKHGLAKENDYISEPKDDGYRSYHLIYRYHSTATKHSVYGDLKIEIQLRTRLQHAWATAVETVATFSGQPLKSGGGQQEWRWFFALMSSAIAFREGAPPVPGTPVRKDELVRELRTLTKRLKVENVLEGWRLSLRHLPTKGATNAVAFLLELDPSGDTPTVKYTGFTEDNLARATQTYLAKEKQLDRGGKPGAQVVLVSTSSMKALRSAFPNYHLDTQVFIEALRYAIK
jgi:ppGpp synthetase/RelA/SpoT-type nucleotidyltranferase